MPGTPAPTDPLLAQIEKKIHELLAIKRRLPLLRRLSEELERLAGGPMFPIRNGGVYQLVTDSYDMLVIDLASLREGMLARRGLFKMLEQDPGRFREYSAEDCAAGPIIWVGEQPSPEIRDDAERREREWLASRWNDVLRELFPDASPVASEHVRELREKFQDETEQVVRDRNRVRAHRYEDAASEASRHRLSLGQVEAQVGVFEKYLKALYLFLTPGTEYGMRPPIAYNEDGTAEDLADLILLGSINSAVNKYRVATVESGTPPRWYWQRRKQFFSDGGRVVDLQDSEVGAG